MVGIRIFLAGNQNTIFNSDDALGIKRYLLTYADLKVKSYAQQCFNYYSKQNVELFLDSGAYSAMTKGVPIKLSEYISFVRSNAHRFKWVAALDDINSASRSLENYLDMKRVLDEKGIINFHLLPTYHYGEPTSYLEQYASETNYMAIGGLVGRDASDIKKMTAPTLIKFGKEMSTIARKINPKIQIHLFGVGIELVIKSLARYIDSVDTTEWINPVRFGDLSIKGYKMETNKMVYSRLAKYLRYEIMKWTKLETDINDYLNVTV